MDGSPVSVLNLSRVLSGGAWPTRGAERRGQVKRENRTGGPLPDLRLRYDEGPTTVVRELVNLAQETSGTSLPPGRFRRSRGRANSVFWDLRTQIAEKRCTVEVREE